MTTIQKVILEATDPQAAADFYQDAFALNGQIGVRAGEEPTNGFRGYSLSLIVSQPGNADALIDGATEAGATTLKPAKKSIWGYGGVVAAPDGAIWKIATSSKKDTEPATKSIDQIVLLIGASDVGDSKRFYSERGLEVGKSFVGRYVEFDLPDSNVKLALYKHAALAKDVGVEPEGSGSHRLAIGTEGDSFTDPDGFMWEGSAALRD